MKKKSAQSLGTIFAIPIVIAVATTVGLVSALTGDDWRDWLSWATLGVPVAATWWATQVRRS